jgi:hypothetical protein
MRLGDLLGGIGRGAEAPEGLRRKTIVTVLGMHRSGTSAVAGMLAAHGVEFGAVRMRNRFNQRGNRELPELNELHEKILERAGGTWWSPPSEVRVRSRDRSRRNRILGEIPGDTIGVKDPRMLVCPDLWNDLDLKPIGVIRNPVAVRESLAFRAGERPHKHPQLSPRQWEDVWVVYNRALLAEHRRRPFPVIDFDRPDEVDARVTAALERWSIERADGSEFFEPALVRQASDADWSAQVESPEALELWRALARLAAS